MAVQIKYSLDRAWRRQYRLRILPRKRWHVIRMEDAERMLLANCAELVIQDQPQECVRG